MTDNEDRGFYNPHSGLKGRDGGPYLDQIERQVAEGRRAVAENREPNYDDPLPATVGVPLVPAALVVDNSLTSNPSMANRPGLELILDDSVLNDQDEDSEFTLVKPTSVLPVDTSTEPYDPENQDVSECDVNLIMTNRGDQVGADTGDQVNADVTTDNGDQNLGS